MCHILWKRLMLKLKLRLTMLSLLKSLDVTRKLTKSLNCVNVLAKNEKIENVFNQNENITPEEKIKNLGNGSVEIVTISLNKLLHCIVVLLINIIFEIGLLRI